MTREKAFEIYNEVYTPIPKVPVENADEWNTSVVDHMRRVCEAASDEEGANVIDWWYSRFDDGQDAPLRDARKIRRLAGLPEEEVKEWRCFFCDEVFHSRKAAWLHFGDDGCEQDVPACVEPLRTDEQARMNELREARSWAVERDRAAIRAEETIDQLNMEFDEFKAITGCANIHKLRMWVDSQNGRVATAEALIKGFKLRDASLAERIIG